MIGLMLVACATVPLTGRTQLSLVGDAEMLQMSLTNYQQVLQKSKLSRNRNQVAMVPPGRPPGRRSGRGFPQGKRPGK